MCHPDNPDKKKFLCISGPRRSSKTWGVLNAVVEHAWLVPGAHVSILVPTLSSGIDGGIWALLTETIIPDWISGHFGLTWHKEPHISGASKKPLCSIVNLHGGVSKIQLDSVREGEQAVARQYKGKIFTMVVCSEAADWIRTRRTFDLLIECFRKPGIVPRHNTLIFDTNPSDEGAKSWIYQLWWEFQQAEDKDVPPELIPLKHQLALFEMFVSDNPYLSKEDVALMVASYAHNPDLKARYLEGKWVVAGSDGVFANVFRPAAHVVGDIETVVNPNPDTLMPEDSCQELITGWDPGISNYAAVILERVWRKRADGKGEEAMFKVLDELVKLDSDYTIGEFTEEMLLKMNFWEAQLGRKVRWIHFADRSVFDYRESISDRYPHQEVYAVSKGRIQLQSVDKGDGSVRQRIDILRKLFFHNRIFFSNQKCPMLIHSIQGLRKDKTRPIAKQSPHKHAFDALTYPISSLCFEEMEMAVRGVVAKPQSGLLTINL